jgi:hypothetical protein
LIGIYPFCCALQLNKLKIKIRIGIFEISRAITYNDLRLKDVGAFEAQIIL